MRINKTLLKYIILLASVILLSSIVVRLLGGGETLADYAKNNPDIATPPVVETIPPTVKVTPSIVETAEPATPVENASMPTSMPKEDLENINNAEDSKDKKNAGDSATTDSSTNDSSNSSTNAPSDSSTNDSSDDSNKTQDTVPLDRYTYQEGFYYEPLSEEVKNRITGVSYHENPNITYDDLRYLSLLYYDFQGQVQTGELICNKAIAKDFMEIFFELYQNEYQIESIRLVDEFDGDDTKSMEANNTSCFNYRVVDGTSSLSKHALGLAIDINPFYNPYVVFNKDGTGETYISPKGSEIYTDRSKDFPYKIDENDLCYRLFKAHGFTWGGNWNSMKDYQHFQKKIN